MERAVAVVDTGVQELGQHVVAVGGADQALNRQTHLLGNERREDISEVSGGHADVEA